MQSLTEFGADCLLEIRPGQSDTAGMLSKLGELYVAGVNPEFQRCQEINAVPPVSLPPYPFQKKRYWITEIADYVQKATQETVKSQALPSPAGRGYPKGG